MSYQTSTYAGDVKHAICCTGDAVVGDCVAFERATFSGSLRKPRFAGFVLVKGEIVADSYGADKQQHTFTLRLADGSSVRIKGRNLYATTLFRMPWADESLRRKVADEKHIRGDNARAQRRVRIESAWARFEDA